MKNHYGTFWDPNVMHDIQFIFDTNKHDALIGGNPVRQQLCIIDSILACKDGPGANYPPDVTPPPCRLIMGTFAGAVDWYVARRLREPNNWYAAGKYNPVVMDRYLTEFGYTPSDLDAIEFTGGQAASLPRTPHDAGAKASFEVSLSAPHKPSSAYFSLPQCEKSITIFDPRGVRVRDLHASTTAGRILWDGTTSRGAKAHAGPFVVRVIAGSTAQTGQICIGL
jgi:hypothetical protein